MSEIAIDFKKYKKISSFIFAASALDYQSIKDQKTKRGRQKIILKNGWFIFCFINIFIFYIATCIVLAMKAQHDVKMFFYFMCTFGSTGVAIIRIIYFYIYKSDIGRMSKFLYKTYTQQQVEYYGLSENIKGFTKIINIFLTSCIIAVTFFFLTPILTIIMTGERTFGPLSPFDERAATIEIYPIALLWTLWCFSLIAISSSAGDIILYSSMCICTIEFQILRRDFKDLMFYKNLRITNEVKKLIDRHNKLFDNVQQLEEIFSFPLFCFYYSNVFVICFSAFQASTSNDAGEIIGMAFYCISGLFGIYIQCYLGDKLMSVSESILFGVYECGWEDMNDVEVKRQLTFVIKRACKPAKLTVKKFADISLLQFANVVSLSFSFYTFCRRFYHKT